MKIAGQFLHLIDPPCERMICVSDFGVSIFPDMNATLDEQVTMVRRAGAFLGLEPITRSSGRTVTYEVVGTWAEVRFEVRATFPCDPLDELLRREAVPA